jgi:hypothetical protein
MSLSFCIFNVSETAQVVNEILYRQILQENLRPIYRWSAVPALSIFIQFQYIVLILNIRPVLQSSKTNMCREYLSVTRQSVTASLQSLNSCRLVEVKKSTNSTPRISRAMLSEAENCFSAKSSVLGSNRRPCDLTLAVQ